MSAVLSVMEVFLSIFFLILLFSIVSKEKISIRLFVMTFLLRSVLVAIFVILKDLLHVDFFAYFDLVLSYILMCFIVFRTLPKTLIIFYGLFIPTIWNLFYRAISFFILPLFGNLDDILNQFGIFFLGLSVLFVYLFMKWLDYDFYRLRMDLLESKDKKILYFSNWILLSYMIIIEILTFLEHEQHINTLDYRRVVVVVYLIVVLGIIKQLDAYIKEQLQAKLDFQKELQLSQMENYINHIEELYREVKGFRHDYSNILTTLRLAIEGKDMEQVEAIYQSVLKDSHKKLRQQKYDLGRLVHIKDSALKSLLAAKFIQASENDIQVDLEVLEEIQLQGMELIDFIIIVSILVDNAIEAAKEADEARLGIAFFSSQKGKQILIVENTTQAKSVDISKIYSFGVSSKGEDRGVGLYNIMKILDHYPTVSLNTSSHDNTFRQTLEISLTLVN